MSLFPVTNRERPYEQLLYYPSVYSFFQSVTAGLKTLSSDVTSYQCQRCLSCASDSLLLDELLLTSLFTLLLISNELTQGRRHCTYKLGSEL